MDAQCYKGTYHWKGRDYDVSVRCEAEGVPWVLVKGPCTREEFESERAHFAEFITSERFGGPEDVTWVENWGTQYQQVIFSERRESIVNPHLGDAEVERMLRRTGNQPVSFSIEVRPISQSEVAAVFESETHWTEALTPSSDSSVDR